MVKSSDCVVCMAEGGIALYLASKCYIKVRSNMSNLQQEANKVWDIAVYIQLMGALDPATDFNNIKKYVLEVWDFFQEEDDSDIEEKLPEIREFLENIAREYKAKYPLEKEISEIAKDWNELFKDRNDVFSRGVSYGWLKKRVDLSHLFKLDYAPYHMRVGLVAHSGHLSIEEDFLLKDAFSALVNAEHYYAVLCKYGEVEKKLAREQGKQEFDVTTYSAIADIKQEVSSYSRLAVVSFYSFVECFVNSVGYSHFKSYEQVLSENEKEILRGRRKGNFIQLRSKIERYQKIIRSDNQAIIITSDSVQTQEPFSSFFLYYQELRNSSVHYSPEKEDIWLKPEEWIDRSKSFSRLAVEVSSQFWKACFDKESGPEYLNDLDYDTYYQNANDAKSRIKKIENQLVNP